jgi:putative ribosome biogenesis GTPase RsgA
MPTNVTEAIIPDDDPENPSKETLAMVRRAILEGWPIDPRIRQMVVNQAAIIAATATKERDRTSAMKVLVAADAQNLKRADLAIKLDNHENPHDARDIATSLNINITVEAAQQQAELAAIAEEIRTRRVVEAVHVRPAGIGHSADGGASETGSQGSDGNGEVRSS